MPRIVSDLYISNYIRKNRSGILSGLAVRMVEDFNISYEKAISIIVEYANRNH